MKTKRRFFGVSACVNTVAEYMSSTDDHSVTTIRVALNDCFDSADRDGYRIPTDYDQSRAVAAVLRLLMSHDAD